MALLSTGPVMFALLVAWVVLAPPDTSLARPVAPLIAAVDAYLAPFTAVGERPVLRVEWIDLTADGRDDALVTVESASWCGSGGCTLLVAEAMAGEDADEFGPFRVAAEVAYTNGEVAVLHASSHGWRDLVVRRGAGWAVLQFDGETYPSSPAAGLALTGGLPECDLLFAGR